MRLSGKISRVASKYWPAIGFGEGIWILILIFFSSFTCAGNNTHRYFDIREGLSQSYVYCIFQDIHGYLWAGTGDGLSRFDGFRFSNYTTRDSLADNFITCGLADDPLIWFGHMNGRLTCYDGKIFYALKFPFSAGSPVTRIRKGPDNRIWVSSYSGTLFCFDRQGNLFKQYQCKDPIAISDFDFAGRDTLLIGTGTGLLVCHILANGELIKINEVQGLEESRIVRIHRMKDGNAFYAATENDGLFRIAVKDGRFTSNRIVIEGDADCTGVQDFLEINKRTFLVCTFGEGLIRIRLSGTGLKAETELLNASGEETFLNVKTVFVDREGDLWCSNYGKGLVEISSNPFLVQSSGNPAYGTRIFSLSNSSHWRWAGTGKGLIKIDAVKNQTVDFFGTKDGLPSDTVTALYAGNGNCLWIGTSKHGLYRMDENGRSIKRFPLKDGSLENSITALCGIGDQVWVGTKKGLCRIETGSQQIKWFSISQGGLPHNYVTGLLADSQGRIWVCSHSNILAYLQNDKIYKIRLSGKTGNFTLGPLAEDEQARIWVGSSGNGIYRIDSDSVMNITASEGLLSDYCYSLICDNHANLWVGHRDGLTRVDLGNFGAFPIRQIGDQNEVFQFEPNAVCRDSLNKVWFGSDKGMIGYDPEGEPVVNMPPVLNIISLIINGRDRKVSKRILLSPGQYNIQIGYLGISLKNPDQVTYQIMLKGYDQSPEITQNRSVTYHHLAAGKYSFNIQAGNGSGAITQSPLTLWFVIQEPVWKKWWFYLLAILILSGLTFGYIRRRIYIFKREKAILEEKVNQRTLEIQCQKNEIELQRDLIDKKNTDILSSISYASQIQMSVLPPDDLINKFFPENFILSRPKDIVSGDFYWLAEADHKIVLTVADCTGHGVPGAFMSLLGITLLKEVVQLEEIMRSDLIVTRLRERMIQSMQQTRKDVAMSDGMDIALCVIDPVLHKIQFTGGMNEIILIQDGKLEVIKPDHTSVSALYESSSQFTMQEIIYRPGDLIYLYTDGYQDQFGGPRNKKYMSHRLRDSLLEIHYLPAIEQKRILEERLDEWMQDNPQTDDITVMGIRLLD